MGVDAVVIVENSRNISLAEFVNTLRGDEWGKFTIDRYDRGWGEFEWEGKRYLTWYFAPRVAYLGLYDEDSGDEPNGDNPVQLTFLKVMLTVERVAGGPIFVGNDVVCVSDPDEAWDDYPFFLPPELDRLIPAWRDVEHVEVDNPQMIF